MPPPKKIHPFRQNFHFAAGVLFLVLADAINVIFLLATVTFKSYLFSKYFFYLLVYFVFLHELEWIYTYFHRSEPTQFVF